MKIFNKPPIARMHHKNDTVNLMFKKIGCDGMSPKKLCNY